MPVRAAGRLWDPYARDVLQTLHDQGVRRVLSLPLAPHSVHVYHAVVRGAAEGLGIQVREVPSWGTHPALVAAFVEAVSEASARFASPAGLHVVLTAHSLPLRILASGDPYERDFRAMADAVAAGLVAAGFDATAIHVAFQSQGMGGGEWLGPDLVSSFEQLRGAGVAKLLIAPIGFLAEHVETLYDIDVEAAGKAAALGFERFERMPAMNTRPTFIAALEAVAREHLG
jgi:ferrochelatase